MTKIRILIVDDDSDVIYTETLFLENSGYEVTSASGIDDALAELGRATFDLLVLDYDLGVGRTGLQLFDRARAAGFAMPAILMTAMGGDDPVVGALRAGLHDFIRKGEGCLPKLAEAIPRVLAKVSAEREKHEADARAFKDQGAQAEHARALDRFAEGLSHNLNNMLTTVIGFSELELRRHEASSPTRRSLERILQGGQRAASVVKQLTAASGRHRTEASVVALADHMQETKKVLLELGRPEVVIRLDAAPGLARIRADPEHVKQILMNLAIRACDVMPEGGRFELSAQNFDLDGTGDSGPMRPPPGRYVKLSVADTGPALTDHALRHAFEPFHDVRATRHGSGLELAAAYGFVRLNGGHIAVRPGDVGGTVIEICFLRAEET